MKETVEVKEGDMVVLYRQKGVVYAKRVSRKNNSWKSMGDFVAQSFAAGLRESPEDIRL